MSANIEFHNLGKMPEQGLAVIQCGKTVCSGGHSVNLMTLLHNSLTFIISGRGTYTVAGKTYDVDKGKGFLIPAGVSVSYTADKKEPWAYYYVIFGGADWEALMKSAGLNASRPVFSFPENEETSLRMMFEESKDFSAFGVDVLGRFLMIVGELIRNAEHPPVDKAGAEQYLSHAVSFIADHYPYNITVEEIAEYVMIDRTYLFKLFRKRFGMSPLKYLCDYRVEKAIGLMENEHMTLGEIAASTGFYDLSHFHRAFIKKTGCSPGEYRKGLKNNK